VKVEISRLTHAGLWEQRWHVLTPATLSSFCVRTLVAKSSRLRPASAFTLVEIMIVVVIIGLLAAIAVPAFQRIRERSVASRMANDFRQFESAFQRYSMEYGTVPAPAAGGVIPTGMDGYLPISYTAVSPVAGNYLWSGPSSNIVLRHSNATDSLMQRVDEILDDGNLTTGEFRKTSGVGYHLRVR
jgi:prepilin-type N-terminal cleavage/methylation domain-containing protein